ncbi:hypothetical protein CALCODRAFT_444472 [Calocera cornea HHB12733]|uniref:Uncharacterized protein n=1 Tax=Calocera cornea HHB12733 TaxID=1353952 RepID=A0A165CBL0_9BASI|nr:hypothetical protein CALCODRAFT_444472 [Calocera cornea HHB12733]
MENQTAQASKYFDKHGARWSEFNRLPYFDPIAMGVIDPMHTFLQGLMKTQWYHNWVLGGKDKVRVLRAGTEAGARRELDEIHAMLATFEMPVSYARLPSQVGEPAGGSLTSDEWRALAVLYGPAAVRAFLLLPVPALTIRQIPPVLLKAAREQPATRGRSQADGRAPVPKPRVHPNAASNYLKLAAVLKIFMRRELLEPELERARGLYLEYFEEYHQIYGAQNVTPTFHWVTHMGDQVRRYGPVHGFWTFLFERLNKVLKTCQTNGHKGGAVELTFAREFKREMVLVRMVSTVLSHCSLC